MIWGAHWCLIFYLFSANVRASLSSKPQTENLVSEISVPEQGTSEKKKDFSLWFLLLLRQSPRLLELMFSPRHSHPVRTRSRASKEGVQAVHAEPDRCRGPIHPVVLCFHTAKKVAEQQEFGFELRVLLS